MSHLCFSQGRQYSLRILLLTILFVGCDSPETTSCHDGICSIIPGCKNLQQLICSEEQLCAEKVCEGIAWTCGYTASGQLSWTQNSAQCDDQDPCTQEDHCRRGKCKGIPIDCSSPPEAECKDDNTLNIWLPNGHCQSGNCVYTSTSMNCPEGCIKNQCAGTSCEGVICEAPLGPCAGSPGQCISGECFYPALPAGTPCTPNDPCIQLASCDSKGSCVGTPIDCSRPNTTDGYCNDGLCQGYQCKLDWGDCNQSWSDGCETPLGDISNCNSCNDTCETYPNSTPECKSGNCSIACTTPYADCDADKTNGCEIPINTPNVCDSAGLNSSTGCGTAYCGIRSGYRIASF